MTSRGDGWPKASGGSFVAALVFFVMTASIAIFLLLTALGRMAVGGDGLLHPFVIVGGFFAVLAAVIYLLAIREGVERIRDQVETVYDVARAAREGYE